jgi:hypothetical protein
VCGWHSAVDRGKDSGGAHQCSGESHVSFFGMPISDDVPALKFVHTVLAVLVLWLEFTAGVDVNQRQDVRSCPTYLRAQEAGSGVGGLHLRLRGDPIATHADRADRTGIGPGSILTDIRVPGAAR